MRNEKVEQLTLPTADELKAVFTNSFDIEGAIDLLCHGQLPPYLYVEEHLKLLMREDVRLRKMLGEHLFLLHNLTDIDVGVDSIRTLIHGIVIGYFLHEQTLTREVK